MATILISAALAAIIGAIVWKMISDRRKGKSSCDGCCSSCAMKDNCHKPQ